VTPRGTLPLLIARDLSLPLCWRAGQAISAGQFIAQAQALAEQLPPGRPINLCQDRYHFALGLAAALLRGQTSLMPPNALAETLRQVPADGGQPYLLVDTETSTDAGLPTLRLGGLPVVQPAREVPQVAMDLEAVCLLTSGSTGAPQPHAKRWHTLVTNIGAEAERLAQMLNLPSLQGITLVATVPAQHSYGLESTVLLALLGGACFEAGRPFYPADIVDALHRVPEPRALVTTPFHLKTLLLAGLQPPAVALTLSATAPLSPQLAGQAEQALGGQLIEIYGCTEAGQVASRRTTAGETWQTLGALRISQSVGRDGESYVVAGGHVLEPTALADVLDLQDSQHFKLLGRANDLIHVAGKRSSLAHLNFHLNRIEGVDDGAFWLPDEVAEGVVRPVAFVVAPTLSAAQIITALRTQLESVFVPRRVVLVDNLPREATGKLTVAALRQFALAHLAAAPVAASRTEPPADAWFDVVPDHPTLAGHFPGHPVLPGVTVLSWVMQALAERPDLAAALGDHPGVAHAKFLNAATPGSRLRVVLKAQGQSVAFEVTSGTVPVARGLLTAGGSGTSSTSSAATAPSQAAAS
jgi:3-hydroxymyristoyl/3-hydroxydecanoyl-(acyl carrier protein) dehydratase